MKGRVHVTQICDEVTDVSGSLVGGIRYAPVYMTQVSSSKPQLFFFYPFSSFEWFSPVHTRFHLTRIYRSCATQAYFSSLSPQITLSSA